MSLGGIPRDMPLLLRIEVMLTNRLMPVLGALLWALCSTIAPVRAQPSPEPTVPPPAAATIAPSPAAAPAVGEVEAPGQRATGAVPADGAGAGPSAPPAAAAAAAQPPAAAPAVAAIDPAAFEQVQLRVLELSDEVEMLREDQQFQEAQLGQAMPKSNLFSGYVDLGFFLVQGDGSGIRTDAGFRNYPEYRDSGIPDTWVFLGDPLSTMINSRGEPADTGESRALVFDSVDSRGGPSFIANAVGVNLFSALSDDATVNAMIDLLPRTRNVSKPEGVGLGDFIDVKLAYAEYKLPVDGIGLALYAGKFDSVLGVEYRTQDAPDRLGVTPSLICRYTCGRPIGVKARLTLFDALVTNVSVTNGSHMVEMFPFNNEIDLNGVPTVAGRLSLWVSKQAGFDVGISGSYGPQDLQTEGDPIHKHAGADLRLDVADLIVSLEGVIGEVAGETDAGSDTKCDVAPCLEYKGAYGKFAYRVTNWWTPYARIGFRDALHTDGASFVYISQLWRLTVGTQFDVGEKAAFKAEYILNQEMTNGPQFPNDVFTSSLVLGY